MSSISALRSVPLVDQACFNPTQGEPMRGILYNGHAGLGANLIDGQPVDGNKNEVAIETVEVRGIVTDNKDPDKLLRAPAWFWLPEVDDQVLVAFEHGDPRQAVVHGALWTSADEPPQSR